MEDKKMGFIQALGSLSFLFSFCMYLIGYGYYTGILQNLFSTSASITSFMSWDIVLVKGIALTIQYLLYGTFLAMGLLIYKLNSKKSKKGNWGYTYAFDQNSVQNANWITVIMILLLIAVIKIISRAGLLQKNETLFILFLQFYVGITIAHLLYYLLGVFNLTNDTYERIKTGLYVTFLSALLLFNSARGLGQYVSTSIKDGKKQLAYPKINLVTNCQFPVLKKSNSHAICPQGNYNYEVHFFAQNENNYFAIDEETLTIHAIPRERVETFWYLPKQEQTIYGGIGVSLVAKDSLIFVFDIPDLHSPVIAAGIKKGDIILEVDGKALAGCTSTEAANIIRGPIGTELVLTVHRPGEKQTFSCRLMRKTIKTKT